MTDESRQNTSHTKDILQSSSLIQRLDQRRTQPVGLIDGSQFQSQSSRLPTTIVQRFALLDQLQTRYGVHDRDSGTSTELTFATRSQDKAAQTNSSISEQAIARQTPTTPSITSHTPPAQQFRVSRKPVPFVNPSDLPTTSAKLEHRKTPTTVTAQTNSSISEQAIARQTPTTASITSHTPPAQQFRVSRKPVPFVNPSDLPTTSAKLEHRKISSLEKHSNSAIAHPSTSSSQSLRVQNLAATPGTVTQTSPSLILRKEINNHTTEPSANDFTNSSYSKDLLTIDETPQPEVMSDKPKANAPLVLRKATLASQDNPSRGRSEKFAVAPATTARTITEGIRGQSTQGGLAPSVPLVRATSTALVLQRQPESISATNEHSTTQPVASANKNKVAVSSEMPVTENSVSKPSMVWRKSSHERLPGNDFSSAINNGQLIAQKATTANTSLTIPTRSMQTSNAMSTNTMSTARQAAMPAPEINVAQIAEQVSRILCRQLTVERERRGIRK
ncbi:hypothetical protein NIES4073_42710 [Kalymmatonema gypsitolerans NIES-4073]|nr:hypothetical protein NIES4073_42710 [Scytonema sp. NIES-4073]